jgi:hypothetical protein
MKCHKLSYLAIWRDVLYFDDFFANKAIPKRVSSGLNNGMNQTVVGLGGAWGF